MLYLIPLDLSGAFFNLILSTSGEKTTPKLQGWIEENFNPLWYHICVSRTVAFNISLSSCWKFWGDISSTSIGPGSACRTPKKDQWEVNLPHKDGVSSFPGCFFEYSNCIFASSLGWQESMDFIAQVSIYFDNIQDLFGGNSLPLTSSGFLSDQIKKIQKQFPSQWTG